MPQVTRDSPHDPSLGLRGILLFISCPTQNKSLDDCGDSTVRSYLCTQNHDNIWIVPTNADPSTIAVEPWISSWGFKQMEFYLDFENLFGMYGQPRAALPRHND